MYFKTQVIFTRPCRFFELSKKTIICIDFETENRDVRASYVHSSITQGFIFGVTLWLM